MKGSTTNAMAAVMNTPVSDVPQKIKLELELHESAWRNMMFLLDESYSKWGAEANHHAREGQYAAEVLELLDVLDDVREQYEEQGYGWETNE